MHAINNLQNTVQQLNFRTEAQDTTIHNLTERLAQFDARTNEPPLMNQPSSSGIASTPMPGLSAQYSPAFPPTFNNRPPHYKPRAPPVFNPDELDTKDRSKKMEDWLIQMKTWLWEMDPERTWSNELMITRTAQYLAGSAGSWWRSTMHRIRVRVQEGVNGADREWNWDAFIGQMCGMYMDANMGEQRERQFWTITQTSSVRDFLAQLNSLANMLSDRPNDTVLARRFFTGLKPNIQQQLDVQGYSPHQVTWEVLREKALVLDQAGKPSPSRLLAMGEASDSDDWSDGDDGGDDHSDGHGEGGDQLLAMPSSRGRDNKGRYQGKGKSKADPVRGQSSGRGRSLGYGRSSERSTNHKDLKPGQKLDRNGNIMRCHVCESTMHLKTECPHTGN